MFDISFEMSFSKKKPSGAQNKKRKKQKIDAARANSQPIAQFMIGTNFSFK